MADVEVKRFDMVLSEALDRISRDQEDVAALFTQCDRVCGRGRIHSCQYPDSNGYLKNCTIHSRQESPRLGGRVKAET